MDLFGDFDLNLIDLTPLVNPIVKSIWALSLVIAAIGIGLVFIILAKKLRGATAEKRYLPKALLTPNELEFFGRLIEALPEYYVFPQVALGAMLIPKVAETHKEFYRVRNTFSQKIADFVICGKNLNVVAIVELDDKTHNLAKDAKRDAMLAQAGYRVIRWQSRTKPSIAEIQKTLASAA